VFGNPARLEQVFLNLLVYAAQSLPETNDPPGEVRLCMAPDGASRLLVEVVCSGTREMDALTDPARISLAVCRSIVSSLGGEMRFESDADTTRFRVWLPAVGATWSEPPPSSSVEPPPPVSGIRARVLVVDDDPGVGNALRVILEEEHSVTCVGSAAAALELLSSGVAFDVVFCDLMMPDAGGPELFERLRVDYPGLEQSVVFMTGGAYTAHAVEFLASVPNARIDKPFDLRALRRLVQRAAARRWMT
jgi:CheY-like chemotaxis protein